MESPGASRFEVHVELFDAVADGLLDSLDRLLGRRWVAPVSYSGVCRRWWFTHRNDAGHAAELARGVLEEHGSAFLIWLREPDSRRRLLGGSVDGARSDA
jgi:hypothetical protein